MVRMIAVFIFVWAAVAALITFAQTMTGKQLWRVTKLLTFSGICAIIASVLLMALVLLF